MLRSITSLFALCSILIFSSCGDPITVPASDDTPPTIKMVISGLEEDPITLTSDDPPLTIERDFDIRRTIVITATATDEDGGIQDVIIIGETTAACVDLSADLGANVIQSLRADNPDTATVGEEASTVRSTSLSVSMRNAQNICENRGDSYELEGITGTFSAHGENFHGGTVSTPTFTFSIR